LQLAACSFFHRYLLVLAGFVGAALAAMRAVARKGGAARPWREFVILRLAAHRG
jgi:type II secretory pathway component PulF